MSITDYTRRLERLLEICTLLSSNLELKPLLSSLTEAASELTGSESSSILLYQKDTHSLRFIAAPWYVIDSLQPISVPLDRSVAGWVFQNQKPMALNDTSQDSRIFRVVDRGVNTNTRSIMAVPMTVKGKTIGVIESINKLNGAHYTEEDIKILETLCAQAAIAIENARLIEETQEALQQVTQLDRLKSDFMAIASHEIRTPLGLIIGHASLLSEQCCE
ncbi:MAG: GAF domain-containing protein, partial [Chloroflexi bacterium]|nr:GAF domain-containing protein [Chloroflexota bacterium]